MTGSLLDSVAGALEALNVEELVAHYAPDFRFEDVGAGLDIVNRDELRRYFEALFSMPGVAFRVVGRFEGEGGTGALEWVWSGLGPDGATFAVQGSSIVELGPGGITRETIYYKPPALGRP